MIISSGTKDKNHLLLGGGRNIASLLKLLYVFIFCINRIRKHLNNRGKENIRMGKNIIDIHTIDRFKPQLYADLYIPSWVNGYSIAMDFVHNYFISKFPPNFFRTVHIVGKIPYEDFRKYEYGEYIKREKPAMSIGSNVQFDYDFDMLDLHMVGIDRYIKKTDYNKSFFRDPMNKLYLGMIPEAMVVNFQIRTRYDTRAQQMDMYKRMELMFRIGFTETLDVDMDFHIPYELMADLARSAHFNVTEGVIEDPYLFLKYLNKYSKLTFMYKLRYINGKREFFIRMNNMPLHLDTKNKLDAGDGEADGQTMNNFDIDMNLVVRIPVPKFYAFYAECKDVNEIHVLPNTGTNIYSMRVFDIPDVNAKGWVQYATSNYLKDDSAKFVKEIEIESLFKSPVDVRVDISLDDLIEDAIQSGISPSAFIEIAVYTNDMVVKGKLPTHIDWKNKKIVMPDGVMNSYFYLVIYLDLGYTNDKIADINQIYRNRITYSKRREIDRSQDHCTTDIIVEEPEKKE